MAPVIGISDEHVALHATARRWVEAHVDPVATRTALDADRDALPPFWPALCGTGWLGMHLPEAFGGEGFGLLELAVVLEELGRACAPGPFVPTVVTSAAIDALGTGEQRAAWLPRLAGGSSTGAITIPTAASWAWSLGDARPERSAAESGAASRAANVAIEGVRGADGSLVLRGSAPVLGAALADVLVVRARVPGLPGGAWCILTRDDPGVSVVERPSLDATRRMADVALDGVAVDPERELRAEVAPVAVSAIAATILAAECVGGAAWCVDTAAAYARERVQFGRPIGQFQAVKHRCADMLVRLELARAAAWDAARAGFDVDGFAAALGDGVPPEERFSTLVAQQCLAAAVAAATAPNAFFEDAKDCIQVLGGIGYTWEHDAHLYIKRATAVRQLLGGPKPWRRRAAELAAGGARRSLSVELPPEAEPLRDEVRASVAEIKGRPKEEWTRAMADAGYLGPHWPAPWGRDASPLEQLVIDDELARARLRRPHLQVGAWVLPTLIGHGTRAQQERWIRPTLYGHILWCQLFSEPGAGSDLAALTTRAVRDDARGGWVVTGQKVWTTMAHLANWGILLARTDPDAPKHDGITCFVLDMAAPGIDVRPLRELTGAELFNEVFLTEVFVPDECVVGEVHRGWEAARTTLANERVSMGSGSSFGPGLESVLPMLDADHLDHLDELGALVCEAQSIADLGLRATAKALGGTDVGAEASVRKLASTEYEQRVQELGLELLGPAATIVDGAAARWVQGFLGNRALSIAGGTSDVQRNIVAERLLGLPKDPEPGS